MISKIHLKNFKCFADQTLQFKALTLLTGLNGMGKSSVLQALLLLRQSHQQGLLPERGLALNGDLVHIGTAKDALFEGAEKDIIGFSLALESGHKKEWFFNYDQEADVLGLTSPASEADGIYQSSLFGNAFHYLQAERLGPRRFFETSDFLVRQQRQLGVSGEYTAHFLAIFGREDIQPGLARNDASSLNLIDQIEAWLAEVSPGTRIVLTSNAATDTVSLQYSFLMGPQRSKDYRATNVGFGITYILTVLVAVLSSSPGTLLLLENPEAHLHPRGQAMMGELLARAAACGAQILVETHSDHVLNGVRVAVHDGKLKPDDAQLHYFQRRVQDGLAEVISPTMDRNGRIDRWPDGFFDEWDKSLEALLEPGKE
jgi:predicted ATPase